MISNVHLNRTGSIDGTNIKYFHIRPSEQMLSLRYVLTLIY